MKNKFGIFAVILITLTIALGCNLGGLIGSGSEGSGQGKDGSSASGEKKTPAKPSGEVVKIGIPECDELATYINDNSDKIEGSIVARGIVYVYKNLVIENIREGVEKMNDEQKAKMAKVCTKTLEDLKKSMESD